MNKISKVYKALEDNKFITARDGYKLGTNDVRSKISILRRKGIHIVDEWVKNPKTKVRYKRYFLVK